MPNLLFELGCEELPASFVASACADLLSAILIRLTAEFGIPFQGVKFSTPRRLIVGVTGIPSRQEDFSKESRGPAVKAAFGDDGKPLPPLIGFCKSNGVDPASVEVRDGYVWIQKMVVGKSAQHILQELLPDAIKSLTFEKSMRWGSGSMRFARPIRWLLASLDGEPIEFEIQGIRSGLESRGHRFYSPEKFKARTQEELLQELRARKVEPDPAVRMEMIKQQSMALPGGKVDISIELLEENGYLCEWPTAIAGEFKEEHLDLPEDVLVTAMAKHEKMFPVRNGKNMLVNQFVFVRNGGEDDSVRRGTEWVLNARLDDAQFFFKEDQKKSLAEFLDLTDRIVFHADLGTVRDRSERLHDLTSYIAGQTRADESEVDLAARAGLFAKADLSTGLVSELPSLQGIIGGEYAKREGFAEPVCSAIKTQYKLMSNADPVDVSARTGWRLTVADAADKLAGFLGIGEVPSGSSDPYGLRRAATAIIELALSWQEVQATLAPCFVRAAGLYQHQGFEISFDKMFENLHFLFKSRYESLFEQFRYDVLESVIASSSVEDLLHPRLVRFRCEVMNELSQLPGFVQTATRPLNLVESSKKKGELFDGARLSQKIEKLHSESGTQLAAALENAGASIAKSLQSYDLDAAKSTLLSLEAPINTFFEETMVMDSDPEIRSARLSLIDACSLVLKSVGDFSKLVSL